MSDLFDYSWLPERPKAIWLARFWLVCALAGLAGAAAAERVARRFR